MNADTLILLLAGIFGLLVGSFSNVLIWRLPRRENIVFPPSHCPKCDHQLHSIDLVPVFSWLSLGGKCRYCKAPINPRYPIVEAVTGVAYTAIAALYPVSAYGIAPLGLMFLFTILLAGSLIDLAVFELPDELTLVGVALGLLFAFLHKGVGVLPSLPEALNGALMGAGIIVLISLLGSWVMRRFRERQHPEFPIGYQQISLGLLVGAWFAIFQHDLKGLLAYSTISHLGLIVLLLFKPLLKLWDAAPRPEAKVIFEWIVETAAAGARGAPRWRDSRAARCVFRIPFRARSGTA